MTGGTKTRGASDRGGAIDLDPFSPHGLKRDKTTLSVKTEKIILFTLLLYNELHGNFEIRLSWISKYSVSFYSILLHLFRV